MIYGIAPRWRGRGLASRAARIAARWALSLPGVTAVELRIGQGHQASQHVAANAGFAMAGTITQYVPAPGETFKDLRYILEQQPEPSNPALPACQDDPKSAVRGRAATLSGAAVQPGWLGVQVRRRVRG